jgi:capsular polysaccharide biosynthesis protein
MAGIVDGPLSVSVVRNALISAFEYDPSTTEIRGAVYDSNGDLVPASMRLSGAHGDRVRAGYPETKKPTGTERRIPSAIYLGHLMDHYGHFLMETVSTFWAIPYLQEQRFLFHPFLFGASIKPWMKPFFVSNGISSSKVEVIDSDLLVDHLLVPERSYGVNTFLHVRQAEVYRAVKNMVELAVVPKGVGRHVFVSRSRLSKNIRGVTNAAAFDQAMERSGFAVIFPETMTIEEQVRIYASADILCGFAGSALHNCVFMEPGSHLIELGDARTPTFTLRTQNMCCELARVRLSHIDYRSMSAPRDDEIDIEWTVSQVQALAQS